MRILAAAMAGFFGVAFAQDVADETVIDPVGEIVDIAIEVEEPVIEAAFFNDSVSDPINVVCPFKSSVGYKTGEVTCGFIEVPENREDPDSRTIRLLFAQIHAKASLEDYEPEEDEELEYKSDPVAYLTGGPGVGIPTYVERFLEHDLTKERDLYVLQQRGIAESGSFCPFFNSIRPEINTGTTPLEGQLQQAQRIKDCLLAARARGVDVSAYSTYENAHDVRALRRALGFDEWNVWGISYGSHLGQMLAQVDAEGIRGLVIDAIVPNDLGDLQRINQWIERDIQHVFKRCEEVNNPHCDNLEERLEAVLQAEPLTIETIDEELSPSGQVVVGAEIVPLLAFIMMYEQDEHPAIPATMDFALRVFEDRDTELLSGLTGETGDGGLGVALGMSTAIRCNDGYYAQAALETESDNAAFPRLRGRISTPEGDAAVAQACVEGGAPPRDRADYQLVQSALPTLIINGEWDPVTPPPLAERIVPGFVNSRYIEVPYTGHGPTRSMSECSGQVLGDFFDNPMQDLSALDAACFEEGVEAPEFLTYLTSYAPLMAVSYAGKEEFEKFAPIGLTLGLAVLSSLLTVILMPLGFFARRLAGSGAAGLAPGDMLTRGVAFATALLTVAGLGLMGVGGFIANETAQLSLAVGLAAPAPMGAWLLVLSGVTGVFLVVRTLMVRLKAPMRTGTFFGFLLTGLSSAALVLILSQWDLLPF